ncbi:uncharacterized protein LOC103507871 [Diaphorina citri]|uniref:Uncharacterized protein LOC103507871 n=1 Tax=Diaphorina citri TaxID=121845 RepID=A0A1S3CYR8_DIACI|nr:uncharacterized protein LOC103507871 [Diaphorina citri]KAI5732712.1 hypothetical protein M8J76_003302 [Diaphorina citri]KAI5732976.1 hypothetical protein M8J76_006280 [Diaphorina citri]KAI5733821.1 hypothetical protein M8J76_016365 [Diaphorina citri]
MKISVMFMFLLGFFSHIAITSVGTIRPTMYPRPRTTIDPDKLRPIRTQIREIVKWNAKKKIRYQVIQVETRMPYIHVDDGQTAPPIILYDEYGYPYVSTEKFVFKWPLPNRWPFKRLIIKKPSFNPFEYEKKMFKKYKLKPGKNWNFPINYEKVRYFTTTEEWDFEW